MEVTVHYLFSQNDLIGSQGIVWITKHQDDKLDNSEIPSHVAILINEKWVLESTLKNGVSVMGYNKWKSKNREVAKIKCKQKRHYEDIKKQFKEIKDLDYDYKGVIYLGIHLIKQKITKDNLPKNNKWNNPNKYFCCEVMGKLTNIDYQMTSPLMVMKRLKLLLEA